MKTKKPHRNAARFFQPNPAIKQDYITPRGRVMGRLKNRKANKKELQELLQNIDKDKIVYTLNEAMDEVIRKKYVNPLYQAVASLSKEDLAEMAESLIYLTYLQRRITNAEESVGGPVDVAVLTKGDGFIWIKRKHYFSPDLNAHFFANYFK